MLTPRPTLIARVWTFKDFRGTQVQTRGIGLFSGTYLKAHLTPNEAREFADMLHDLADQLEAKPTNRER